MISYLWFSSKHDSSRSKRARTSPSLGKIDPSTAAMQFSPTQKFIAYVRKLLETTQVSQSVIVLSLHYVYRLRQQNCNTPAQSGSEFRVAVIALMLANKFLDELSPFVSITSVRL
jgi:Cyclin, N-terminal domain